MTTRTRTLDQNDGTLTLRTGVTGRAARMGHRLTIALDSWRASVTFSADTPVAASMVIDVDSLRVIDGAGGLTPLTGPEKVLVRGNALKTLAAQRFPTVEFDAETIEATDAGYRLVGPLTLHGVTRDTAVAVQLTDGTRIGARAAVSHKDFRIRPYSMAMGAMKVADEVAIEFSATLR